MQDIKYQTITDNKNQCQAKDCKNNATLQCLECAKLDFPSFDVCSPECWNNCYSSHIFNWHCNFSACAPSPRPIQLVEIRNQEKDTANLLLCPRGRMTLQNMFSLLNPLDTVYILSMIGTSRGGKSSFLNHFLASRQLGAIDYFAVNSGSKTVTSGLWVYGQLVPLSFTATPVTTGVRYLLFLDSEGTNRGRDSVTSIITSIACQFSSCSIINVRGGLTIPIIEFTNRLALSVKELKEPTAATKRSLIFRCSDIRQEWKNQTGDMNEYLASHLRDSPIISLTFNTFIKTTEVPTDEDLDTPFGALGALDKSPFFNDLQKTFDFILSLAQGAYGAQHAQKGEDILPCLDKLLDQYTSNKGRLIPSCIERIQRQETELEYSTIFQVFTQDLKNEETYIPYYLPGLDTVNGVLSRKMNETLLAFKLACEKLGILPLIVTELENKMSREMSIKMQEVINKKANHDSKIQREVEAVEYAARQEEIKKQATQQKILEERARIEQERLYQIRQAETQRTFALMEIHSNIVNRHFQIERENRDLGRPFRYHYVNSPMGGQYIAGWAYC